MFEEEWAVFPQLYAGHLMLSLSALAVGLIVSVPLGIAAARSDKVATPALGAASVVQTIPGLALLALMVPLMGGKIGFWPAFVALSLYSVLPILRNTIVSLRSVDADVREAALAVGMTARQRLMDVDLPLSAPVIVAGLRTASVWVVGAATLATPVGADSLGGYIFQGLQTRNWGTVIFGCVASAVLALALDQVIALLERGVLKRSRSYLLGALGGFLLILAPASGVIGGAQAGGASIEGPLSGRTVTVGAKTFTEQFILADVLKRALEAQGATVRVLSGLGSTVAFDALASGEIDLYVDYTGTVWATVMSRDDPVSPGEMYAQEQDWLMEERGVEAFGRLGFENAYAFATTRETAARLNLASIADMAGTGASLASDPEFFGRSEWTRTRDAYGLADVRPRGMDSTFMYDAVRNGEVDAVTAYTTDGRIDAYDLVLLDDPLGVLPPYEAFIMLAPGVDEDVKAALAPLRQSISNEQMRRANAMVDLERLSVSDAGAWLWGEVGN